MAASSSSSPSPSQWFLYDVFLSFSGTDTRNTFTSHLLAALEKQRFSTFRDDTKLGRGEDICSQLPRAISESRVSIVVFSKNYAASEWCLDELVKIMECRKDFNQIVLPIFYNVDPSDVERQMGDYAEAFEKHEATSSVEMVGRWRKALNEASHLSGWPLQNEVNRDEAKLITKVVNKVISIFDQLYCNVAENPVGIDSRVQELKRMLKLESDDVTIVAVWGVGGIGKTTIAKAVFNSIRNNFEGFSFLADVSETTKTLSGVVSLQKQLLSNILQNDTHSLDNYHQGIDLIKKKLCHWRVLLVLDDVDHVRQLKMLAINRRMLGAGSKIIITTRNVSSLMSIQVNSLYSPAGLNDVESLKLFSLNAFKTDHPVEGYSELSREVVTYAEGLPLALEVLGSYFSGRSKAECESGLRKLRKHPLDDIQVKLKISFESLDKKDQDLFLDIAFFFTGREKDFAVNVLEDLECFPEIGIGELVRRCLIRVDVDNKLRMHNILREMAREIVYQESSEEPGKRSRLKGHEEVLQMLRDSVGSEAIEGLYLELPEFNNEHIDVAAFADMRNLRLLHLNYLCHLSGTSLTITRKLKWLCWHGFPLARIPDDVYMENLVAIDLQYSKLKQIWRGPKRLDKLRFLNLSYSCCLTKTPDFSGLKNLEELLLHDCTNLVEVDYSIGCLEKLVILNMANCRSLRKIPSSIFMLTSLQHLNIAGYSFEQGQSRGFFPMFRRMLPYYKECVPISAVSIQGLQALRGLRNLNLSWCNLSNVPSEIGNLMSLEFLDLSGNKFSSLPSTLSNLPLLLGLDLSNCDQLKQLPAFSYNLRRLIADDCVALEFESVGTQLGKVKHMWFRGCPRLDYKKIEKNIIGSIRDGSVLPSYDELSGDLDIYLDRSTSRKFSFVVPDTSHNFRGWILCIMIYLEGMGGLDYEIVNKTKGKRAKYTQTDGPSVCHYGEGIEEVICVDYVRVSENGFNVEGDDEMELFVCRGPNAGRVKNCVIRLICEGDEINLLEPKYHLKTI